MSDLKPVWELCEFLGYDLLPIEFFSYVKRGLTLYSRTGQPILPPDLPGIKRYIEELKWCHSRSLDFEEDWEKFELPKMERNREKILEGIMTSYVSEKEFLKYHLSLSATTSEQDSGAAGEPPSIKPRRSQRHKEKVREIANRKWNKEHQKITIEIWL